MMKEMLRHISYFFHPFKRLPYCLSEGFIEEDQLMLMLHHYIIYFILFFVYHDKLDFTFFFYTSASNVSLKHYPQSASQPSPEISYVGDALPLFVFDRVLGPTPTPTLAVDHMICRQFKQDS